MERSMAKEVFEVKTPEEIKKGLKCCLTSCKGCPYNDPTHCGSALVRDTLTYIRQLESQPRQVGKMVSRWINAKDKLPESDDEVLCWYEYYRFGEYNAMFQTYGIGCYFEGQWLGEVSNGVKAKVLYWMPLPPKPEVK